ncbi:uncharacterized protein LOC123346607 [Mauremys mutica]|uniref:uncharacterized protein LOC123346607 n=1 Tax=Mauremys mutica TaxID=74926 RepID=UPI001D1642AA|nr:uncharacterized protein LOC123346607 [Mauremys mutica]
MGRKWCTDPGVGIMDFCESCNQGEMLGRGLWPRKGEGLVLFCLDSHLSQKREDTCCHGDCGELHGIYYPTAEGKLRHGQSSTEEQAHRMPGQILGQLGEEPKPGTLHWLELTLPWLCRAISCSWLQAHQSPAPTAASLRREMGNWAEADPPGQPLNSSIDLESGGEPGHPANSSSRKPAVWDRPAALRAIIVVTMVVIIALVAALIVVTSKQPPPLPPAARTAGSGSKGNGSLLPYEGKLDHWIGLRKDAGQVWKWADGTEFDHWFEIHGGADCAQLDEDFTVVTTSSCSTPRKWICSKSDTPGKGEEGAVGGDS